MACNTSKLTAAEKYDAVVKAVAFYRGAQRVLLQDVACMACRKAKKSIDARSMTKYITGLDASVLEALNISLERTGKKGPVTIVFSQTVRSEEKRDNIAA